MKNKYLEPIKSVILTILFALMATLASVVIVQSQRLALQPSVKVDIDRLLTLKEAGSTAADFELSRVCPAFIGYNIDGEQKGLSGSAELMRDMFATVSPVLGNLFGENSVCAAITDKVSADNIWLSCYSAENYVYIKFHSPLPYPVLYMYLTDELYMETSKAASGDICYVSEIFIIFDEQDESGGYKYHGVSRDAAGVVSYYMPRTDYDGYDTDELRVYGTNSELYEYAFAESVPLTLNNLTLTDSTAFTDFPTVSKSASFISNSPLDEEETQELLRLFNYNPDRLHHYNEENTGSSVYVETHGSLTLSQDEIRYSTPDSNSSDDNSSDSQNYGSNSAVDSSDENVSDGAADTNATEGYTQGGKVSGGIEVSEYLEYGSNGGSYSLYELIRSAENLITSLKTINSGLVGGDGELELTGIYESRQSIVLEYSLFFDNLPVYVNAASETGENLQRRLVLKLEISQNRYIGIWLYPVDIESQLTKTLNLSQKRALTSLDRELERNKTNESADGTSAVSLPKTVSPALVYTVDYDDAATAPQWVMIEEEAAAKDELE